MPGMVRPNRFLLATLFFLAIPAAAEVTQPDGTVMPLSPNNGEVTLQDLFDHREGDGVMNMVDDADTAPATFRPLCDFTAQFVLAEAGNRDHPVGWYNSPSDDTPPTLVCDPMTDLDENMDPCDGDEIYIILDGLGDDDDPRFSEDDGADPLNNPGPVFTGADLVNHPHYAGGEIGFVLISGEPHYSERRLNPVCVPTGDPPSCTEGEHWIPTIMYESATEPNAFYMGVEDQNVGPAVWGGNDGDFQDIVIYFTGLVCSGAGEECDTGLDGACERGITECADSSGQSECVPIVKPEDETCNGIDDDCNGDIDDGDLCDMNEVCFRGRCVPRCTSGEFRCSADKACHETGVCVDRECLEVECDSGLVCDNGECVGPCKGVVCPTGQFCSGGRCVDPCDGVECGSKEVCKSGVCVPSCDCTGCGDGEACSTDTGLCGDPDCADVSCDAGTHCEDGACVDDCEGAICPGGAECEIGVCGEPDPTGEGGAAGAGSGTGGGISVDGGLGGNGGTPGDRDAGAGASAGSGIGNDTLIEPAGCGCRYASGGMLSSWAVLLSAAGALWTARRRRRRA